MGAKSLLWGGFDPECPQPRCWWRAGVVLRFLLSPDSPVTCSAENKHTKLQRHGSFISSGREAGLLG